MKRVLITGASGFIGIQSLPILLKNDCEVHGVSLHEPKEGIVGVMWHQVDLLNANQRKKLIEEIQPTHILHFAWIATPGEYWTSPKNDEWKDATLHLLLLAEENGVKRFVGAGTCAEYDWSTGQCDEASTPLKPNTPYGRTKASCGTQVIEHKGNVSTAWGRIFHLYGPHEYPQRLVSSVILSLLKDNPAECMEGSQIRSFLHVKDVADAFVALLLSDVKGAVNIASREEITLADIVREIAHQLNKEDLLRLGARETPPNDPPKITASTKRLYEEVGWKPTFTMQSGIADTIAWFTMNESAENK
jgi:nucleoside-diphosphate-sugar epimerase